MPVRAVLLLAALCALTACSPSGDEIKGDPIGCAIGPASALSDDCRLERVGRGASAQFIAHHPDGGFRRFVQASDGSGIIPADGADEAVSTVAGDVIEIALGQDRYRIPLALLKDNHDR